MCGRNIGRDFGVGDVFASLWWTHSERDDRSGEYVELDAAKSADVSLRVAEIGYYNGTVERLYPVHSACIRFSGDGLGCVLGIDFDGDLRAGRWWSLRGSPDAEPGAAADGGA